MATRKQIEANKRNAQRGTGPRTAEGKAKVALNALQHGLTAKTIVLPGERPKHFEAFRLSMLRDLNPAGEMMQALAEKLVIDFWRCRRPPVFEVELFGQGCTLYSDPYTYSGRTSDGSQKAPVAITNLLRYDMTLSRICLRDLETYQKLQASRTAIPTHLEVGEVNDVDSDNEIANLNDVDAGDKLANLHNLDGENELANPKPGLREKARSTEFVLLEPDVTPPEVCKVRVPFFITKSQKRELKSLGYADKQIAMMKPKHAQRILKI